MQGDKVSLTALETANSTKINRKKVLPHNTITVHVGDEINFGKDGPYKLVDLNGVAKPIEAVSRVEPTQPYGVSQERVSKRGADQKISLTNPDAKYWVDKKVQERMAEDGILNKHAEKLRDNDNKRQRLEELNSRRLAAEEKVKALKARSEQLADEATSLVDQKRKNEKEVSEGREMFAKVGVCT